METIDNRNDITLLVHTFYARIRNDEVLGPIFNSNIKDDQLPTHLTTLTDFWETILFGVQKFK